MSHFYISVYFQGKSYCFKVETLKLSRDLAQYKVSGKNRSIILQTNTPYLQFASLKYKTASWKIVDGISPAKELLEEIIKQLEMYGGKEL